MSVQIPPCIRAVFASLSIRTLVLLGVVALVSGGAATAVALRASGLKAAATQEEPLDVGSATGLVKKFDGISNSVCESTTVIADYVDMPGTTKTFSISGAAREEVVVMFQGFFQVPVGQLALFRLVIDGVPDPQFGIVTAGAGQHGFNWITPPLAPGPHTALIQWKASSPSAGRVDICTRSSIILHK